MTEQNTDHDWPVLESHVEYETGWFDAGYDRVKQPDGTEKQYYWAALPPAVVVVARHEESIVMIEQYRPAIGKHCLELPAGIVEDDESYAEAGARELREETGFDPDSVTMLEDYWVATGAMRHERAIVFAEGLTSVEANLDENEFLSVTQVPVEEALSRARADPANDATIQGLLLAREDGFL